MRADGASDDSAAHSAALRSARRDGLTLGLAVGVVGIVFGVLARSAGLSVPKTCVMSLLVFTGASQFASVGVVGTGGSDLAALGSALLLAARNALYGPVVARWFRGDPAARRAAVAQVIIDESTGIGAAQPDVAASRVGFLASGLGTYVAWNLGTLAGAAAGDLVGDLERWGLDAAFPAVFVALLAPHLTTRPGRVTAAVAGAVAVAAVPALPVGVPILLASLGAVAGAMVAGREGSAPAAVPR